MADDGEKLGTGGRVPDDGVDAGTRGRVSGEDLGVPHTSTPASDSNVGIPTRGRVPGGGVDVGTGGRISDEETYIPVAVAPPSVTRPKRITVAEDPYKYRVPEFDVMLKIPGQDNISLLNERVLMRIGNIIKEFEQDYGQFAVSSVPVTISNLRDFTNLLPDDQIIEAEILYGPDREPIFKGILSQKTSDLDIERDEAVLDLEGTLKKYENVSAEMMWGTTYELNKFKRLTAVVDKCISEMGLDESQVIIEEPELTGAEYSFSYYDRADKDEVVNSVAVDENGIVYQCTEHKTYSLDPETGATKKILEIQKDTSPQVLFHAISNLLYYDQYLYWAEIKEINFIVNGIDSPQSQINLWRCKKDGTVKESLKTFSGPTRTYIHTSETLSYIIGDGMANSNDYPYYPYEPYIFEVIGFFTDRYKLLGNGSSVQLTKWTYVDFVYSESIESTIYWIDGSKINIPNTEQEIRVFRDRYITQNVQENPNEQVLVQDYVGKLPMYLPSGNYSFVALPCEVDLPDGAGIQDKNNKLVYVYKDYSPWQAPKKFKITFKFNWNFEMVICNGVLFYTEPGWGTAVKKLNLSTLENAQLFYFYPHSLPMPLNTVGQSLIVGYKNQVNKIREYQVNSYSDIQLISEVTVDTDTKYFLKGVTKLGSDLLFILENEDYPNLKETKFNIGGQVGGWSSFDAWMQQGVPPDPPFYMDFKANIRWDLLSRTNLQYYYPIIHPPAGYLYIFQAGKVEEIESNIDNINCFKQGDGLSFVNSGDDPYFSPSSLISQILYDQKQNIFWVNRTRLDIFPPQNTLQSHSKIYKEMGKLPSYSKVKSLSGHELVNHTTVYDEEYEIPLYGVMEKTEPVKLTNKNVYRDAEFKITQDNGILIPSTDYTIRDNMGTDKNETWIYLNLIYQGKKVLVTYKYVDPEKVYGNFLMARGKIFFTESKTGKLISFDGTQFAEEGLTYLETQADQSVKTITEPIKVNETKVQSNLVYDSTRDRIYGIIGPGDNVLFQYAKDIALYIPDCKFLNKNVLEVLGECARICNFVVYMDDDGMFYFMPRDYQIETYALTEAEIYSLNTRMAAYEFGETYEKITVRFDGGEVVLGEGIKEYSTGSDYISCRGWATVLDNDLWNYFALNPRIFTIVPKFANGIRPLHGVQISYPPKNIYCYAQVQRVGLNPEDLKMEITAREKKSR